MDPGHHIGVPCHEDGSGQSGGKVIGSCLVHKRVAGAVDESADAGAGRLPGGSFEKQCKSHACKAAGD